MNAATEFLTGPPAQAIGWALLHLLWQATLVAGVLAATLALMKKQSANARYAAACGALAVVFVMFLATATRAYDPAAAPIALSPGDEEATMRVPLTRIPVLLAESAALGARDRLLATAASAREALPAIVAIWLAGVILLSSRLLVSWTRARQLIRRGAVPANPQWQRVAASLSESLGLRRAVQLLESAAVEVPSVIGSLRPVILIPTSTLTGLTPEHIEMVLAHELAHIRRHDFFVNLLQAFVETLMFYHPAVWWMSQRVRIERENCCDDLAVAICGNPLQYARALTRLEELRASTLPMVIAANGGSLLDRIRRIAAGRAERTSTSPRWAAAVALLSILAIAAAVPSLPALAQREQKSAEAARVAEASVEVVGETTDAGADTDAGTDLDADLETDLDLAAPDIDVDVQAGIDPPDTDFDFDFAGLAPDLGYYAALAPPAPDAPDTPEIPYPVIAPVAPPAMPFPRLTPLAAPRAPRAPLAVPGPAPAPMPSPALAPRAPRAPFPPTPVAALAGGFDYDFDFDFDSNEEADRPLGDGKLTVDELISLRATGVTLPYVDNMKTIFPGLTLREVTSLSAVGVTPEYIHSMRAAGFEVKKAREAVSLKAVGVTPEFLKEMRAAGMNVSGIRDITSLKAVGVTPAFIQEMRAAGFEIREARDATSLRAVGVSPEFVQQMRKFGFDVKRARDFTSLRAVGVTAEWLKAMRAAGVEIKTARDASSLRALGVDPAFVKKLADAGYTNLSIRELQRLAAAGVDDEFIREMSKYKTKNR